MYSILSYGKMIADKRRMEAYAESLRRTIKPASVVADLGTGTGIFALLACRLGARRVFAIEPGDVIHVARQIAHANGFGDRIEFIQAESTKAVLTERADVIVSDMRGMLPFYGNHILSIIDARTRMLAPGGILIPRRDTMRVAVVEAHDIYNRLMNPWKENDYGFDMSPGLPYVFNSRNREQVKPDQLLTEPRTWATLDYAGIENPNACGEVRWIMERAGTAHGLAIWFDAELAEGVGFSNAPDEPELIYGITFLPWSAPVSLSEGDAVSVKISADLVGEEYIWRWDAAVYEQGNVSLKAGFKQSSFYGMLLFPSRLRKRRDDHSPELNEEGRIDRFVLDLMNGDLSLSEIARRLYQEFPSRFARLNDAVERVRNLSERYSR